MEKDVARKREDMILGLIWTFTIFLLPGIPELAQWLFVSDKEAHFFFFFWAAIIWTSQERRYGRVAWVLALVGFGIEVVQGSVPGRSMDLEDFLVDFIGIWVGFLFRWAFDLRFQATFRPFHHV